MAGNIDSKIILHKIIFILLTDMVLTVITSSRLVRLNERWRRLINVTLLMEWRGARVVKGGGL